MRKYIEKTLSISLSCAALTVFPGCSTFENEWETIDLENELVSVRVAPQIGGRVIQYSLGGHDYFWVNQELKGKGPSPTGLGPEGGGLNYGGEKLWPAPQGWQDDVFQWPGPPGAVLDGSPHAFEIVENNRAIKLTSGKDAQSGIQFSRTIRIFDNTTRVSVDAEMKNIDTKMRRWGIWSVAQLNAESSNEQGYKKLRGYCPLNPNSQYKKGYGVIYGAQNNEAFSVDKENGLVVVNYNEEVGKIGIDSPAGWVATVDSESGYVFVERFEFEAEEEYPDNASVEFWLEGIGEIEAYNTTIKMPDNPNHLLESELLGPLTTLEPGDSTIFHYDWYAAKIGGDYVITDCSEYGVVCGGLSADISDGKVLISGRLGLFYKGTVDIRVLDADERVITEEMGFEVAPEKPLVMDTLELKLKPSDRPESVVLTLRDVAGTEMGVLARIEL